ncbi:MAG: nuclear transport factor 2 family protein [Terriglobia bacterium]
MKVSRVVLVPLLAVALAGVLKAQEAGGKRPDQAATQQVLKLEQQVNQAMEKNDWSLVARMLSPNMDYTNESGQLHTQADLVNALKSGKMKFFTMTHSDLRARAYGDSGGTVVVTGISTSRLRMGSKLYAGPRRFTDVWVKRNGEWRMIARHVTNVATPYPLTPST